MLKQDMLMFNWIHETSVQKLRIIECLSVFQFSYSLENITHESKADSDSLPPVVMETDDVQLSEEINMENEVEVSNHVHLICVSFHETTIKTEFNSTCGPHCLLRMLKPTASSSQRAPSSRKPQHSSPRGTEGSSGASIWQNSHTTTTEAKLNHPDQSFLRVWDERRGWMSAPFDLCTKTGEKKTWDV